MKFFYSGYILLIIGNAFIATSCEKESNYTRMDGALHLNIDARASKQNPAWSPDYNFVLLTNFPNGYNTEPADILVFNISTQSTQVLISDGSANINLPGSTWNAATHKIVFSSSRGEHDEIYTIDETGGNLQKITERMNKMAYEPSFSANGAWIIFESHELDREDNGILTKFKTDGTSSYIELTNSTDDCRQPNCSLAGNLILYQQLSGGQWNIWVMDTLGSNKRQVTSGAGDKTDGSFSPDGNYIVYSSNESGEEYANIYIIPVNGGNSIRVTNSGTYDGAPSWSPDGLKIIFESSPNDPDRPTHWTPADPGGTEIWIINSPI